MMSFSDVLKGNLLAEFSAISVSGIVTAVGLAFFLSLFIVFIYKITYTGVCLNSGFIGCIVMISMVTAVVIQVITSNVVLSLGMVGALSIVRFRTAVKEPTDTAFLFWAITTGIICGAGYVTISILATVLLGLLFVALHVFSRKNARTSYMVVARFDTSCNAEKELSKLPGYRMKNKTLNHEMTELVFQVALQNSAMEKLSRIQKMPGVMEISIMESVSGSVL